MKDILWLEHPDEVSGITIFDTGHKVYWTEGRSSYLVILHPDGRVEEMQADEPEAEPYICPNGPTTDNMRPMLPGEIADYDMTRGDGP